MYISEVSGHRSATIAIEKAIRAMQPDSEILNLNAFNYTNPISEKIINRIYMGVIKRAPKIWHYLYDNPKIVKRMQKLKNRVHKFNTPKLKVLFDQFRPDAIICSQAFPCGMVADYKKHFNSDLKLIAVLTDYIPHSYWVYDTVDYYIVPSDDVKSQLSKKGVPTHKILSLGIPFDHRFNEPLDRLKLFQKYRLNPDLPTVLIMGGGQGLGPIKTIVKSLERSTYKIQEIVVAGTNKRLYKSMRKKIKKYKNKISLFAFTDSINELMDICDVIISKPGGVTTAEVLAKRIPMIIVKPIPGQEASNAAYLTERGAAIRTEKPEHIHTLVEKLLQDKVKINQLRESAGKISKPNASLDIAKLVLNL
ncbi:MAG: glycosyltransferase [Candidatus Omnitrophica bacterium]|nr:glycosyltransferase [Candidatus Omnitrophota bacterium]